MKAGVAQGGAGGANRKERDAAGHLRAPSRRAAATRGDPHSRREWT